MAKRYKQRMHTIRLLPYQREALVMLCGRNRGRIYRAWLRLRLWWKFR